ncbi:flippase [Candidatus Pacearchaeota archaeon]|nr:flippase [Candidatus Pacearchaeota archaeon]
MNHKEKFEASLKLIAKSSIIVFIGIVFSKILSYIYRIAIARYFGPEIYGLFSISIVIIALFTTFFSMGLGDGILRFIPFYRGRNENDKIKYLFQTPLLALIVSGIFAGLILFFTSDFISLNIFHDSKLIILLKIFSFLIPISIMSGFFLSVLRAFEKIGWYSFIFNILQNLVKVIVVGILIFFSFETEAIITSYFLGITSIVVFAYLVCRYSLPYLFESYNLSKKAKANIYKELFSYSWPIIFLGVIGIIFYWIDSIFLGYYKGAFSVGLYNAAVPIAVLLSFVPELFIQLFFPLITREYSKTNMDVIKELSKQVGKWIFIINLPVFILIILFPGAAINILFGQEYLSAGNSLRILSIGIFFSSLFLISSQLISMAGKSKLVLFNMVFASLLNIILNFVFIPMDNILFIENSQGINGAALATAISMIFLYLLFLFQAKHYLSILPIRRKMVNILLISIIPTVILVYLRNFVRTNIISILILSSLFLLVYALLIIITKSLDKNDLMIIGSVISKFYNFKNRIFNQKNPLF